MKTIATILLVLTISLGNAQTTEQIDKLFEPFDSPAHPAVAALVIHKGKVVYQKAFGSTHLDYLQPATVETKFQVDQMARHFTAFGVLLLEEQGKLSLKDDVRQYLPELPAYAEIVTLRHLLSQTSGLQGIWSLKNIAGWRRNDPFTSTDAMDLIMSQKELDFKPGTDYADVNTNTFLLAKVISKISGQPFPDFMKESVFEPLGMVNTLFSESESEHIPGVAAFYELQEGGFSRGTMNYGISGPSNLFTSVQDLAKWHLNLETPVLGSQKIASKLSAPATLDNGSTIDPSYGRFTLGQQLIHKERGIPKRYLTGSLGGHSSSIFDFFDKQFTVFVLSSGIPYNGYLGMQTAYLFLEDQFIEPASINFSRLKTKKLSTKQLKAYEGFYWNEKSAYSRSIRLENDTLRYIRTSGRSSNIIPISDNKFVMMVGGDEKITVSFEKENGLNRMELVIGASAPILSYTRNQIQYRAQDLLKYTGQYFCKALGVVYELKIKEGQLTASSFRNPEITLTPVSMGLFEGNRSFFASVKYKIDEDGDVLGFDLYTPEVQNLKFNKL